jgi:orotidine-5'-phosphate decarboxylase
MHLFYTEDLEMDEAPPPDDEKEVTEEEVQRGLRRLEAIDDLILALDVSELSEVIQVVEQLDGLVERFKVGLEMYTVASPAQCQNAIRSVRDKAEIMHDLKLHDIPNTVAKAVRNLAKIGAWGVTVHASGGTDMLRAAVEAAAERVKIIGVTVLTSLDEDSCKRNYGVSPSTATLAFCEMLVESGVTHVVCSPQEVAEIMKRGFGLIPICPGVRPSWAAANDQKRVMTPGEAVKAMNGGGHLVVGRPIMQPPGEMSRREAAKRVLEEIAQAY